MDEKNRLLELLEKEENEEYEREKQKEEQKRIQDAENERKKLKKMIEGSEIKMRMAEKYKKKALELVERTEKTLLEIKNRAKKHEEDEKKAREDNDYAKERILRICTCDITLINAQCTCHYCMEDPYGPHTCYGCGTCYSYIEDLDERLIKTNRAALYASDKEGIVMSPYKSAYERLVKSTATTPASQRIYSTSSPNTLPDIDDSLLSKSMLASSLTDLLNISSVEDILNRTIQLDDSIEEKENAIEEEENVVGNKKIASCDDVTLEEENVVENKKIASSV